MKKSGCSNFDLAPQIPCLSQNHVLVANRVGCCDNKHHFSVCQRSEIIAENAFPKWQDYLPKYNSDLFFYEMNRVNSIGGKCFFLGSSEETLDKIRSKAESEYPNLKFFSYSPPYKSEFNEADNNLMIDAINKVVPDVLFVGMTAPKQEKWAHQHFDELEVGHVCCIGAVFDFYAGTVKRAPNWMIQIGLEWSYRLIKEPRRMWRRYLIGNFLFVRYIIMEKLRLT